MARKQPLPIAACPNADTWTDKDTYKAEKRRAAVGLLTDNSLSERSASKEECVELDNTEVIMDHHQLGSIPLNIDLCLFVFIPGTVGKIDYN